MKYPVLLAAVAFTFATNAFAQEQQTGIRALEVEQYENAKRIFTGLVAKNAADAQNNYYLGAAYIGQDNLDSAKYWFNKAVNANSASPYGYIGLGRIDLENNNKANAKVNFDKAGMLAAKDAKALIEAARNCTQASNKDLDNALVLLNKAKVLAPKDADMFDAFGDVYLEKNDGTNAATNYDRATTANPNYVRAYVGTGQIYTRALSYTTAKEAFTKAISIDANYAPIYKYLGELEFRASKYDKAIENYKKFVELTDNSISTQIRYASFLFLAKDYKQTYDITNSVVQKDSSNLLVFRLLGYSGYETNNYPRGLYAMKKFVANYNPTKIIVQDYEYLGKLQGKLGEDSLAAINLKKAIELDPTKTDLWGNIGEAYYTKKKYKESAEAYSKKIAASAKPTATDLFFAGRAQYFANDLVSADSSFARLTRVKPDFINAWSYRAKINANLDPDTKLALAKPYYEKVIELGAADTKKNKKDLVESYSYLGSYYYFAKDNASSKANWLKVIEIDPENKQAADVLKQLK